MAGYLETLTSYYRAIISPSAAQAESAKLSPPRLPNCEDHFIPDEQRPVVVYDLNSEPLFGTNALRDPAGDSYCQAQNTNREFLTPLAVHVQYAGFKNFNPKFTCVDEVEIVYTDCAIYIPYLKTE